MNTTKQLTVYSPWVMSTVSFVKVAVFSVAVSVISACDEVDKEQQQRTSVASINADDFTLAQLASERAATQQAIEFLEARVARDPEDFGAQNRLSHYYLQRLRETGNLGFLELAFSAARASLAALPETINVGGLAVLALAEHAAHNFAAARTAANRLIQLDPDKSYPYAILGDALLELGEYEPAQAAFRKMEHLDGGGVESETRAARLALLRGETEPAKQHLVKALALAENLNPPPREAIAWCQWQLGEAAFSGGDYETAENLYREALRTYPDYPAALASLGRVRAARGELKSAIEFYQRAVRLFPDPAFLAALGDVYQSAGQEKNAAAQYALVEKIGQLGALNGASYNRQLALFYADHDLKAEEAYRNATSEYELRQDIYGADAVAWTALKVGKLAEARAAIEQALRLGTRDAKLFYHAGMIARADGDKARARNYLTRALTLNPKFDPLQAPLAERALKDLK